MGYFKNKRIKQKSKPNPFILIEKRLLQAPEWIQIGHTARDIYLELKLNFNGFNNGELIASYNHLRKKYGYGYETISEAFKRLIKYQFIELTQRGELAGLFGIKANKYRLAGKHEKIFE